ncbi:hypothetical protein ACIQ6K_34690 [Streptomyces sp. NPDC096354]|uniref:hypothetical protein n=1 Tax=Streptomyces sp. NPDC096354 TaxID=3366088 RepID=UPI0037F67FF7
MPPVRADNVNLSYEVVGVHIDAVDAGAASATVNTMQQVGGSNGTALLNTLATTR